MDVELGHDMPLAMRAAIARDVGDAVHHQHRRLGQLRVAGAEKLATGAFQQIVAIEAARILGHDGDPFHLRAKCALRSHIIARIPLATLWRARHAPRVLVVPRRGIAIFV